MGEEHVPPAEEGSAEELAEAVAEEKPEGPDTIEAEQAPEEEPAEAEPVETEETEGSLAEEEPAEAEAEPVAMPARPRSPVAAWPFLVYLALWAGLVTATVLLLTGPDAADVPFDDPVYPLFLLSALLLVACGPLLSGVVWLVARARRERGDRSGLLTTALIRGAAVTLFGVVAWWAALLLVDALRLGLV